MSNVREPLSEPLRGLPALAMVIKSVLMLMLLLVVVGVFGLGGVILVDQIIMPAYTQLGAEVELPDIVEKEFYAARRDLSPLGVTLEKIGEEYHAVIPEGSIIEQSPQAFSRVKKGRTVEAVVSRGPERVIIPDLLRQGEEQARTRLRQSNLEPGSVSRRADSAPPGTVIEQNPFAGAQAIRGTRVNMVISTGPERITEPVPRLVNRDVFEAIRLIRALNGRIRVEWVQDDQNMMFTVLEQVPSPGVMVGAATVFDLKVSLLPGVVAPALPDTVGYGAPPPPPAGT
jgi:eukaryotic-like serine/threonine-protein kinase